MATSSAGKPNRAELAKALGNNPKLLRQVEALFDQVAAIPVVPDVAPIIQSVSDLDLAVGVATASAFQAISDLAALRDEQALLQGAPGRATVEDVSELGKAVDGLLQAPPCSAVEAVAKLQADVDALVKTPPADLSDLAGLRIEMDALRKAPPVDVAGDIARIQQDVAFLMAAPPVIPAASGSTSTSGAGSARGMGVACHALQTSADVVQFTADSIVVDNVGGTLPTILTSVNVSPNKTTAGPIANGRDQAGAFANNTWVYLYVIWNGTTTAGLWSLSATSPTLPTGYTHFAMVHPANTTAAGFLPQYASDRDVQYFNSTPAVLSGGTATVNTAVACSSRIPPISRLAKLELLYSDSVAGSQGVINTTDAVANRTIFAYAPVSSVGIYEVVSGECVTSATQQVFYANGAATATMFIYVTGFRW